MQAPQNYLGKLVGLHMMEPQGLLVTRKYLQLLQELKHLNRKAFCNSFLAAAFPLVVCTMVCRTRTALISHTLVSVAYWAYFPAPLFLVI